MQTKVDDRELALRFMSSGVIVISAEGFVTLFNERLLSLFSAPSDLITAGIAWETYLHRLGPLLGWDCERAERVIANHRLWFEKSEPTQVEHHFDDGKVIRVICRPMADGGAVLTYDDVTDAHRQAEDKRRVEADARDAERKFKLLVEGIADYAIYLLNPDGTVANWNAGAERTKGYTAAEIIGQPCARFHSEADCAAGQPEDALATALRDGRCEIEGLQFRKDGTSFWAHILICPIFEDDNSLLGFAKITRDLTEQNRSAERIAYLARHDALTGLPNRIQFVERLDAELEAARKSGGNIAVVNIDLDGFKAVNDTHGHAVGDALLQTLATRMAEDRQDGEMIGRFGGDEFVALKQYTALAELHDFLIRLQIALTRPVALAHQDLVPGASFGVASFPADATVREKLLSNADLAMYRAKASIDAKVCFYEARMDEIARERRLLAADIWTGLAQDQFCLHYQVQRSLQSGEISGYEALLRWTHPLRGNIPPSFFIPIAEESGAILALGDWVLETACRQAAEHGLPRVAVNLSPLQLNNVAIVERIHDILLRTGLSPHRLELEVTESAVIADRDRALFILRKLKSMGVRIAIDDFGTGYSSLETLRAFPFDRIKLDRSFTDGLETDRKAKAFVRAMLTLGHSLDLCVLAEGVETESQMNILVAEGCNEMQGYLFGHPAPIVSFHGRLAGERPSAAA